MDEHKFILISDNCADLDYNFYSSNNIHLVSVSYTMNNVTYSDIENFLPANEFYNQIRLGSMPITHQANPENFSEVFSEALKFGKDILYLGFSSGLSGTFQSAVIAKEELCEKYPNQNIVLVDSLCASAGQGLLLTTALELRNSGCTAQETADWLEKHKLNIVHDVVTVDLFHLQRGGRISKTAAIIGTALGIKPTIYLDSSGKLVPFGKARGLKLAFAGMSERMQKAFDATITDKVFISHSNVLQYAQELSDKIHEIFPTVEISIMDIGPVIGSHTGVGTVALFYFAKTREIPSIK